MVPPEQALSKTGSIAYISSGGWFIVMDRRSTRIGLIFILTALSVGVLPVIPVGEVLAPEHSGVATIGNSAPSSSQNPLLDNSSALSPVADATTIEKLRHLFSH